MKAFIFDPLWNDLVTEALTKKLHDSGLETILVTDIAPLSECAALFAGDEERIICFNPDYMNWKLTSDDYKDIPNLKAILIASTSFSWVDTTYADTNDIPICNTKNWSTESVAEWAITMMFNLARQVPRLIKDGFPLDFDKDFMKYRGIELKGKTAAVVGMGNIGTAIAERVEGLGMNVIYWSREPKDVQYEYADLAKLFASADVLFPTMAINEDTKKIITSELLESMKESAILVTIAHGLFDENAAVEMVRDKKLFGFDTRLNRGRFQNTVKMSGQHQRMPGPLLTQ